MYSFILLGLFTTVLSAPQSEFQSKNLAQPCIPDDCNLPDCLCSSTSVPGNLVNVTNIPQIVLLTFDDAVQVRLYDYYKTALFDRVNPDGCPVQSTYFVSHEYTDYTVVNDLYNRGHEIALHSITHKPDPEYWRNATLQTLNDEFIGERHLINHFANIPENDLNGIRVPFLQLSGNTSYELINIAGLKYDCTWPTQHYMSPPLWPYTLEYKSIQDCEIGPCPTASIPETWVVPMVNWQDDKGVVCAMVDACANIPKDIDGLFQFMKRNFERHYKTNRAPFGFFIHAAWFIVDNTRFEAYIKFLDYIQSLPDVYITSLSRMLEWVQSPTEIQDLKKTWSECPKVESSNCQKKTCQTKKGEEERWFTFCGTDCPQTYPWIGNPLGQ